jgi:hypothetical protein
MNLERVDMSLFKCIKHVLDEIDSCCPYMEYCEGAFHFDDQHDELHFVYGGEVYNGEIKEGVAIQDDCTLINYDNGCGETITKVFLSKNRLSEEEFYDKYERFM